MKTIFRKLFQRTPSSSGQTDERFVFYDIGFHGDRQLLSLIDAMSQECRYFIETGTNVGTTLAYVAQKYPHLQCLSCEPDQAAFDQAVKNTEGLANVHLFNQASQEFLAILRTQYQIAFDQTTLFWLDAHGYGFEWPLQTEIAFITEHFQSAYILIDDFLVPGAAMFGYDSYQGQICSFEYIKNFINPHVTYRLYYPNYTERTSRHHPLRGWGMIEYGQQHAMRALPSTLRSKIREDRHD